jgi:ACS family hexuronate transporter-like MFS transporter
MKRTNFIVLVLAQVFVCFGGLAIPPLIPFIQPELVLSYTQVGSIMTALYLGAMVISFPAGSLTDRLGVKRMILLPQVFMGAFVIGFSLVGSYWTAILLAFAMGVGYGMVNPPTTIGIMNLVKKGKRGFAMSVKQTGVPLGSAIAAGLLPSIAIRLSWRVALIFAGIVTILSGLLSQILYQGHGNEVPLDDTDEISKDPSARPLPKKDIILLGIGGAFCSLVQITLVTYVVLYLKDVRKIDVIWATFCLTLVNIGGVAGRIFWGIFSDWLFKGCRNIVLKMIVFLIFLVSFVLGLDFDLPIVPLFLILIIFGFSAIGWNGVFHAFIGELVRGKMAGRAIGLTMTITFIGNLSGPLIFGMILDLTHSYRIGWFFLCASMVGAFVMFGLVKEKGTSVVKSFLNYL